MSVALVIGGVVAGLLGTGVLWGSLRIRKRRKDAEELIRTVTTDELPALVSECISIFSTKLGQSLSLEDPERAAQLLDAALDAKMQMGAVFAFEREEHWGWFVKPMGAFLGELIRIHAKGRWSPADGGGLCLIIGDEALQMTMHPFDKILKQHQIGDRGDLVTYTMMAIAGPGGLNLPNELTDVPAS